MIINANSLVVICACAILSGESSTWSKESFPNPVKNAKKCGQSRSSFVCDPDGQLFADESKYCYKKPILPFIAAFPNKERVSRR